MIIYMWLPDIDRQLCISTISLLIIRLVGDGGGFCFWQRGEETRSSSTEVGPSWEHMLGILVFPRDTWLISAATAWPQIRELHQVPYLAWTHGHDTFHCSWCLFHHLLGSYWSTFKGSPKSLLSLFLFWTRKIVDSKVMVHFDI